jgi:UDP-2,3-diacylglucosamine pyrophosphatase LpxH
MSIADLLAGSETVAYGEEMVHLELGEREIFVISDLHMAAGLNANGNFDGTENFFADTSIARFLRHLKEKSTPGKKYLLIINGDFIDFLRIRNLPHYPDETQEWSELLAELGINKNISVLEASICQKERIYGLRTDDYKSIWKLHVCHRGHPEVFRSLAAWLAEGNELLIVKGNHDLEWIWKPVRDFLRLILAKEISPAPAQLTSLPQISFVDDKLLIDEKIYIEHGHRYENFTVVQGPAILKGGTELNLPFGSFFNRYLINRIELAYPFIDMVRPRQKILPLLIRERFPLALKMLGWYIPFLVRIIPKKKYLFAFRFLLQVLAIIGLPLALFIFAIWQTYQHRPPTPADATKSSLIWQFILPQIKNFGFLVLSYFLGRVFSMLELSSPSTFFPNAQKIFASHPDFQFITFGHTHNPEQKKSATGHYYNTGTWIPVFEIDAAAVRLDKTYTFLQFFKDGSGAIQSGGLMRWNDDADRIDAMELRDSI